jgi:hypothetical protein
MARAGVYYPPVPFSANYKINYVTQTTNYVGGAEKLKHLY